MAHALFQQRFYSLRDIPWHHLGVVSQEPMDARSAFERIGSYEVDLVPLQLADGTPLEIQHKAIVRQPTPDDPHKRLFGVVGPDYHLVSPQDAVAIWDESVARPVETLGCLYAGEILFITTKLPAFAVRGDEVESYLLLTNPMTGAAAATVRVSPIRVVCKNTLVAAAGAATEQYRLVHDASVKARMAAWLSGTYQRAVVKQRRLHEEFEVMAETHLTDLDAERILARAYPTPPDPVRDAPEDVMAQRQANWEIRTRRVRERRDAAFSLYAGEGTGMREVATKGTTWGLYNSVVECEDYSRGHNDRTIATSALFGERALVKERCYSAVIEFIRSL